MGNRAIAASMLLLTGMCLLNLGRGQMDKPKPASICSLPTSGAVEIEGQVTTRTGRKATLANAGCTVMLEQVQYLQPGQNVRIVGRIAGDRVEFVKFMGFSPNVQNGGPVGGTPFKFHTHDVQLNLWKEDVTLTWYDQMGAPRSIYFGPKVSYLLKDNSDCTAWLLEDDTVVSVQCE